MGFIQQRYHRKPSGETVIMPLPKVTRLSRSPARWMCVILLAAAASCSTMGHPKNDESGLRQSVESFHKAVRWENYILAGNWVSSDQKESFWTLIDDLQQNVRVMEFSPRDISVAPDRIMGSALIQCRYFHLRNPRLTTKTLKQHWQYSQEKKLWFVVHTDFHTILSSP